MYVRHAYVLELCVYSNAEWPIESIPNAASRTTIPSHWEYSHLIRNTDTTFIHSGNGVMMWLRIAAQHIA